MALTVHEFYKKPLNKEQLDQLQNMSKDFIKSLLDYDKESDKKEQDAKQ